MPDPDARHGRPACPFPGLRSFTADEAHLFFGRDGQSDTIVTRLAEAGFVAVVGTSGCGKSSLLRAGALPVLLGGYAVRVGSRWRIADCRPGGDPLGDLSRKLAPLLGTSADEPWLRHGSSSIVDAVRRARARGDLAPDDNVLILVDQFEELFRYRIRESASADRDEKAEFVALLLRSVARRDDRIFVALTMRSDFLGDCTQFRDLPDKINATQYLVPRMTRQQRRAAIEGPIRVAGAAITSRLVQRLLNELGDDQDQLPVLQHALMRTWGAWADRGTPGEPIDVEDYDKVGSIRNALGNHAEEVLRDVEAMLGADRGLTTVKRIFQRLRIRDANGRETRSPATVATLIAITSASPDDVRTALDAFRDDARGRTFIVPLRSDQPVLAAEASIDITHESLIRCWPRLTDVWVREEEDDRRLFTRLASRAEEEGNTPQAFLQGGILQRTAEWWDGRAPNPAWAARYHSGFGAADAYLKASVKREEDERQRQAAEARAAEERRLKEAQRDAELRASNFKKKIAYVGLVLCLVVVGAMVGLWMVARAAAVKAKQAESDASAARSDAVTRLLASKAALAAQDGGAALLPSLLLAATSLQRLPSAEAKSLVSSALSLLPPRANWPSLSAADLAFGGGGELLVTLGDDHRVHIWDVASKAEKRPLGGNVVDRVAIAQDARRAATAAAGAIRVWNVDTSTKLTDLPCPDTGALQISDDGAVLAALCAGRLFMWRTANDWSRFAPVKIGAARATARWTSLSLARDAEVVALASFPSGRSATDYDESVTDRERVIVVQDVKNGRTLAETSVPDNAVTAFLVVGQSFSPALALGDAAGTVSVWDLDRKAKAVLDIDGSKAAWTVKLDGPIAALSRAASGDTLIAATRGGVSSVWSEGEEVARMVGRAGVKVAAMTHADGLAAVVDAQGGVQLWDLSAMDQAMPVRSGVSAAGFSADGSVLVFRSRIPNAGGVVDVGKGAVLRTWRSTVDGFYPIAIALDKQSVFVRELGTPGVRGYPMSLRTYAAGKIGPSRWPQPVRLDSPLSSPRFSADSKHLAGAGVFNPIVLRNASPDARFGVFVWNTASGREELYLPDRGSRIAPAYCFAGSEPRLLVARSTGIAEMSLADGKELPTAIKSAGRVTRLACSPDGQTVAVAETDSSNTRRLRLLAYPSGKEIRSLDLVSTVREISFDKTAKFLTIVDLNSVSLWNLETRDRPVRYPLRSRPLAAILGAQGQLVAVTDRGVTYVRWWPQDLIREACRRAGRDLTPREWAAYMGDEPRTTVCADSR